MSDTSIKLAVAGVAALFFVVVAWFSTVFTIDQGERGIVTTNGALTAVVDPGMHFKLPFFQGVKVISNRQQVSRFDCIDDPKLTPCPRDHAFVLEAYSRDQQPADLRVSVTWHVPGDFDTVKDVFTNYGDLDALATRTIWRKVPQEVKTVFGQFDAVSVIQSRAEFNRRAFEAVAKATDGPLIIDSLQIENIDFSATYEQAVDQQMQQRVAVEKQRALLDQEKINAEIAVTRAKGAADSTKAQADAAAYSTRVQGEASAAAIQARAKALEGNPLLIEQTKAERWDGKLPTTMLPTTAVPFLEVK